MEKLLRANLEKSLDLLRERISNPVEVAAYICPILLLKYLSMLEPAYFEDTRKIIKHKNVVLTLVPEADFFRYRKTFEIVDRIDILLSKSLFCLSEQNDGIRNLFSELDYTSAKFGSIEERCSRLTKIVNFIDEIDLPTLSKISMDNIAITDIISQPYEKRSGERFMLDFSTPNDIASLTSKILAAKEDEKIYDPACGSGQLLLSCMKYSIEHGGSAPLAFGKERNYLIWTLIKINFIFCGYPPDDFKLTDSLWNSLDVGADEQYDVVVSNPPKGALLEREADKELLTKFDLSISTKTSKFNVEYAFLLHMIDSMNRATGRLAVVMLDGLLFREGIEEAIRKNLVERNLIDTVIALPARSLYNTGANVCLLYIRMNKIDKNILFINARPFFETSLGRNNIPADSIARILKTFNEREKVDGFSSLVPAEEVKFNNYSLSPSHYVRELEQKKVINFAAVVEERKKLQYKLKVIEDQLNRLLEDLN
jgi:type I restriction enzyme M protein